LKSERSSESAPDWINDKHGLRFPERLAAKRFLYSPFVHHSRAEVTQQFD
jgi:hypothetical protein